jgi:hypothetical protein
VHFSPQESLELVVGRSKERVFVWLGGTENLGTIQCRDAGPIVARIHDRRIDGIDLVRDCEEALAEALEGRHNDIQAVVDLGLL